MLHSVEYLSDLQAAPRWCSCFRDELSSQWIKMRICWSTFVGGARTSVAQLAARVPGHSYNCSCCSSEQATCLRAHTSTTIHIFQTIYSRVVFRVCGFVDENDQNLRLFPSLHFLLSELSPETPPFSWRPRCLRDSACLLTSKMSKRARPRFSKHKPLGYQVLKIWRTKAKKEAGYKHIFIKRKRNVMHSQCTGTDAMYRVYI